MSSPVPRHFSFVVFPGFELLDLTGPYSVLSAAAETAPHHHWKVCIAAAEPGVVQSAQGLSILADYHLSELAACGLDTLICVGGDPDPVQTALADQAFIGQIRNAGLRAQRCVSICSGTFFLAEAGLAQNRRVTSHWRAVTTLAKRYPDLSVEPDAIYVQDGPVWSSAGVTAGLDLALALVEAEMGRDPALRIARNLLIPRIRSGGQSQYSADLAAQAEGDTRLARLCQAVRQSPEQSWSIDDICERYHLSRRTLTRLCQAELGLPPGLLVERLRLDLARSALVETDASISQIAQHTGFASLQRLERAFQRQMRTSPRAFRARFRSPYAQESLS